MKLVLALGSNQGDRAAHFVRALRALEAAGVRVKRVSPFLETAPVGANGRRHFLNAVAEAETALLPRPLLGRLRRIERASGRRRGPQYAGRKPPRPLDLDLILYGRARIATPELTVPHPGYARRGFVLAPLAAIAPNLRPPGQPYTARQLARRVRG